MGEIKYKFWSGTKMFSDLENVMECLKQQVSGRYDHIGLHNAAFPQYTGLKDKNGVDIYEGDIVRAHFIAPEEGFDLSLKVEFITGCFCVKDKFGSTNPLYEDNSHAKIIGNIYENPELLDSK